jgi:hypothetical protein
MFIRNYDELSLFFNKKYSKNYYRLKDLLNIVKEDKESEEYIKSIGKDITLTIHNDIKINIFKYNITLDIQKDNNLFIFNKDDSNDDPNNKDCEFKINDYNKILFELFGYLRLDVNTINIYFPKNIKNYVISVTRLPKFIKLFNNINILNLILYETKNYGPKCLQSIKNIKSLKNYDIFSEVI